MKYQVRVTIQAVCVFDDIEADTEEDAITQARERVRNFDPESILSEMPKFNISISTTRFEVGGE